MSSHPDNYNGLLDWSTFGPRDPGIADLVHALADRGLRLAEIEGLIHSALKSRLDEIDTNPA